MLKRLNEFLISVLLLPVFLFGQSMYFDGTEAYIFSNDIDIDGITTGDFTIMWWMKLDAAGAGTLLLREYENTTNNTFIQTNSNFMELFVETPAGEPIINIKSNDNPSNWGTAGDLSDGKWHLWGIAADRDLNTGCIITCDGEEPANGYAVRVTSTSTMAGTNTRWAWSRSAAWMTGYIDDVGLWNGSLATVADFVSALTDNDYSDGFGTVTTQPTFYHNFSQGSGQDFNDSAGNGWTLGTDNTVNANDAAWSAENRPLTEDVAVLKFPKVTRSPRFPKY